MAGGTPEQVYRRVPLKADFLGAWKSVRLKHYPTYPIIIISLIMQRNLATKIQAKRESGLTAVRLKRDPPVSMKNSFCLKFWSEIVGWSPKGRLTKSTSVYISCYFLSKNISSLSFKGAQLKVKSGHFLQKHWRSHTECMIWTPSILPFSVTRVLDRFRT